MEAACLLHTHVDESGPSISPKNAVAALYGNIIFLYSVSLSSWDTGAGFEKRSNPRTKVGFCVRANGRHGFASSN